MRDLAILTFEQRMACALAEIARQSWEGGVDDTHIISTMYNWDLLERKVMTATESDAWGHNNDLYEGDDYDALAPEILTLEKSVPQKMRA